MRTLLLSFARHLLGVAWLGLVLALLGVSAISHLAGHLDRQVFIVRGGSMEPTLPIGSIIFVAPVAADELSVGDIVTMRGDPDGVLTHRIVELRPDLAGQLVMRTRGDANQANDAGLVPVSMIVGRVESYAPKLGFVIAFLAMPTGLVAALAASGTLLLIRWAVDDALRRSRRRTEAVRAPQGAAAAGV
ncbi:MAG TPA: signal peptidase I [Candidatus Limnocylindrales bacterium]|jgi:signal peptidase I|nr:signal peptidase I [Candidatus Limnocylindrales bacterium]